MLCFFPVRRDSTRLYGVIALAVLGCRCLHPRPSSISQLQLTLPPCLVHLIPPRGRHLLTSNRR